MLYTHTGIVGNTKALLCEHSDNVNQVYFSTRFDYIVCAYVLYHIWYSWHPHVNTRPCINSQVFITVFISELLGGEISPPKMLKCMCDKSYLKYTILPSISSQYCCPRINVIYTHIFWMTYVVCEPIYCTVYRECCYNGYWDKAVLILYI